MSRSKPNNKNMSFFLLVYVCVCVCFEKEKTNQIAFGFLSPFEAVGSERDSLIVFVFSPQIIKGNVIRVQSDGRTRIRLGKAVFSCC